MKNLILVLVSLVLISCGGEEPKTKETNDKDVEVSEKEIMPDIIDTIYLSDSDSVRENEEDIQNDEDVKDDIEVEDIESDADIEIQDEYITPEKPVYKGLKEPYIDIEKWDIENGRIERYYFFPLEKRTCILEKNIISLIYDENRFMILHAENLDEDVTRVEKIEMCFDGDCVTATEFNKFDPLYLKFKYRGEENSDLILYNLFDFKKDNKKYIIKTDPKIPFDCKMGADNE